MKFDEGNGRFRRTMDKTKHKSINVKHRQDASHIIAKAKPQMGSSSLLMLAPNSCQDVMMVSVQNLRYGWISG